MLYPTGVVSLHYATAKKTHRYDSDRSPVDWRAPKKNIFFLKGYINIKEKNRVKADSAVRNAVLVVVVFVVDPDNQIEGIWSTFNSLSLFLFFLWQLEFGLKIMMLGTLVSFA